MKHLAFSMFLFLTSCQVMDIDPGEVSFSSKELNLDQLRKTYPFLDKETFDSKLEASLERPLMFFRSFPNTYYSDVSVNVDTPVSLCLGDAHPENFGFMLFEDKTEYLFNDLDDAGKCPILLDALRYFTALRMMGLSSSELSIFTRYYIAQMDTAAKTLKIPSSLIENLEKKRKKNLKKYTANDLFLIKDDLIPLPQEEKDQLLAVISPLLSPLKVWDIVANIKEAGGSAGLVRYWVLINNKNTVFDIIELKPRLKPATSWWKEDEQAMKLTEIAEDIWNELPTYFGELEIEGRSFQVRSRTKDDINLSKLKPLEFETVIKVQISLMAKHHLKKVKEAPYVTAKWLDENSDKIAKRYQRAFKNFKSEGP